MFSTLKISEDSIHLTVSSLQKLVLFTLLTRVSWKIKLGKLHIDQKCFVTEAATRSVPCKTVFLEISQNSQENTCDRVSSLIKFQAWGPRPATLLKKKLWHRCFLWILWSFKEHLFYRTPLDDWCAYSWWGFAEELQLFDLRFCFSNDQWKNTV